MRCRCLRRTLRCVGLCLVLTTVALAQAAGDIGGLQSGRALQNASAQNDSVDQNGTATPAPTPAPATNSSRFLNIDGITLVDSGSYARPPVTSGAVCCQPLAYSTPATSARVVAGLRYEMSIISTAAALGTNLSVVRLKLIHNATDNDADCYSNLDVTNFAGAYSAFDGTAIPVTASAEENTFQEARIPYSGLYGACYTADVTQPTPVWRALPNVSFLAFGAPEAATDFWCAAEANRTCTIRIGLPEATSRLTLLTTAGRCGFEPGEPAENPFSQEMSLPSILTSSYADQTFGTYSLIPTETGTFRICLCHEYEYDVDTDGIGTCRSSGAQDFPQSLGFLYLGMVSTVPDAVYPTLHFNLRVHCGNPAEGGCEADESLRIRFIDPGPSGHWGEPIEGDMCRTAAESRSYASPPNCDGSSAFKCNLLPSVVSMSQPAWDDLTVRELMYNKLAQPQRLGVCFCNGAANCAQPDSWMRLGVVTVNPILVLPDPIIVGIRTNLQLYGPQGSWWTTSVAAGSHALKLLYDPNQTHVASTCAVASQTLGTLVNHHCTSELDCTKPSTTSADGPMWQGVVVQRAGYYAVCYCDMHCSEQDRWSLVKWHLVAGPEMMFAGVPTQGTTIYAGSRFELTVLGYGLSASDNLAFFNEGSLCGSPNNIPASGLTFESITTPDLLGAELAGQVGNFQSAGGGSRMVLVVVHGLAVGDMIRFSNVTLKSTDVACQSVYSVPLDRYISHCVEALTAFSLRVMDVPSETEAILDVQMSVEEAAALDFSGAHWYRTSQETFTGLVASRGSQGQYVVCWGKNPSMYLDYSAHAGVLEVLEPHTFLSALHLTSITPGIVAPTILAFELGNSPIYKSAAGPMSLIFGFRNSSRLRHSFRAGELGAPLRVAREAATQGVCGRLFREIWADSEDGFPQPKGCFYNEEVDEYGMVFSPQAGLRPGTRYQVVMFTQVSGSLVSQHEWIVLLGQLPMPPYSPEEVRHTGPNTFGDVGEVSNELSCKEACASTLRCNVAVYRVNSDGHCLLADFSKRQNPYVTSRTLAGATLAMTMFMVDRLNQTNPELEYNGQPYGAQDIVLDVWSMDDMLLQPFGVVESSEAIASDTVGLAPTAIDPRWHLYDGLKVVGDDDVEGGTDTWTPLQLTTEAPKLRLRLRAAPGAPIEAGSSIRLFFWPLTQWALPPDCLVTCTPHDPLHMCSRPGCSAESLVRAPWMASRNMLRVLLPDDMEPITDDVMHTLSIEGRYLALPKGGFLPTKLAAEVSPKHSIGAFQPSVDYAQSTGRLPYVSVTVAGSVLSKDGNSHPFAADSDNILYSRLRLGSTLLAGSTPDAKMVLHLPNGYTCKAATVAPVDLQTLSLWGASPQGRGELDGQWTFLSNTCIYELTAHAAVYGGSSIVVKFTVDNPLAPMSSEDSANAWAVSLTGRGDASSALALEPYVLEGIPGNTLFPRSTAVLGRLAHASLTPTDFWWGAANNVLRIFFRTVQSSFGELGLIKLEVPVGFGFYEHCQVDDLPFLNYAPLQGLYSGKSLAIQPLGDKRVCHASSTGLGVGYRPNVATIHMDTPLTRDTGYGFAIRIMHPRIYEPSQQTGFTLTTCAGDISKPLDQSPSVPLLRATSIDNAPSYGIYNDHARGLIFQAHLSNLLPYAYTQTSARAHVRFRVPMAGDSPDELVQTYSTLIDWRVFAPFGYAWQFSNRIFFFRKEDIEGVTADLPVKRAPLSPVAPPQNRLDFLRENEAIQGWQKDQMYGFDTFINVPPEVPRDSVNEWIIEFGYDRKTLPERMAAMITEAELVRAVHSFNIISLTSKLQGQNNELLFQFGTITPIPEQTGALVLEAPAGFGFEASCTPLAPEVPYSPYKPIPARVDCRARVVAADEGALRPTVSVRPIDADIPRGMWAFLLACVNPSSISNSAGSSNTFLLFSYVDEAAGSLADVGAVTQGFTVMQHLPHAEIVHDVHYTLSGRDDHPGQASNLVFAFDLRSRPALDGDHLLEIMAPRGFEFRTRCEVAIGADVFGLGQPYPSPYVPFSDGVRIVSCTGYYHYARIVVSPGLIEGQSYAFRLRVDQQPQVTPVPNEWRLSFGSEASGALEGFPLWAFDGMALTMSDTSRWNEANPLENSVEITFIAANTITVKGMIFVIAPADYKIRFDCIIEVFQLAEDGVTPSAQVPNTMCRGEQPPVNSAQLRFQSEFAAIVSGVTYRMSVLVTNPSELPVLVGYWTLQSYAEASDETEWSGLVDIGRIPSVPITEYFVTFVVRKISVSSLKALTLQLEFDLELPHVIHADDVITITGPEGYNFASPVADSLLENDFRTCLSFVDRPGSTSLAELPSPLCAGGAIRFRFRSEREAFSKFRFRAVSDWPRVMLASRRSNFAAVHTEKDEATLRGTAVAYLEPIIPRLIDFELAQTGARAAAVSSVGWIELGFRPSQSAQAISITTRIALLDFTLGVSFANVSAEVNVAGQVLKEVLVVHDGESNLALAMHMLSSLKYTFILRGVKNPSMVGTVLWTVRTYLRPKPPGTLASVDMVRNPASQIASAEVERAPHLYTPEEVRLWLDADNLRDEMVDWAAPPTVGRLQIATNSGYLESSFFDFPDTKVSFTMSVTPNAAPPGHRLLIFAPADWQFIKSTFEGEERFPPYVDLGPTPCMDTTRNELRLIYVVRLSNSIRASGPCRFNPSQICKSTVQFSLRAATPPTPKDMPRWLRESNQAWLLQVDAYDGDDCGPAGNVLDNELVRFTNDELFPGFALKESLGGMMVVPEPHGQMSRQKTSIAVEFETRTLLKLDVPLGPPEDLQSVALYLRLDTVYGLDFERGCLAAVPDPDYSFCTGQGKLAIVRIRESTFATGQHRIVLRARNPSKTPEGNLWMLESFVGVNFEEAKQGLFRNVRQRGRAPGYVIWQHLETTLTPASSQRASTTQIFLWVRPSTYVESHGYMEVHAPQDFEVSCKPSVFLIFFPQGACRTFTATSGSELHDLHHVMQIQLSEGSFLLPNNEYEMSFNSRTPAFVGKDFKLSWGVRLSNAMRETLEANMEVGYYNLTNFQFAVVSLVPSATERYAKNEVRLIISFERTLALDDISELRILAPLGWNIQELCTRYKDVTGGDSAYHMQLPYSEERGHHSCPQANVLLLLLDQAAVIKAGIYTLLVGARNPAVATRRNFWTVSLLSPGTNLGWTPAMKDSKVSPGGLKPGQGVVTETIVMGFEVGERLGLTPPPSPLEGNYYEVLSGCTAVLPHLVQHLVVSTLMLCL